jgi:Trk K+ transport system NAD-binding subunit
MELLITIANSDNWKVIDGIATFLSLCIIIYGGNKLFHWWNSIKFFYSNSPCFNSNTIIVIGLCDKNRIYIDSELALGNRLIIVEQNKENLYINEYMKTSNVSVLIANPKEKETLLKLNLDAKKYIVVSTGKDVDNIEIVSQILILNLNVNIYVQIENRNLRYFHKDNGLLKGKNIKIFSYYEDASRELFIKYDIDGENDKIISSNEDYSIVIFGNTHLSHEVIFQACIMGQLPNENKLTIYCLDKNPKRFQQKVALNYTEINNIPNIKIKYIKFDIDSKLSYIKNFWYDRNLTNIFICYENEETNLEIAANLSNITYINEIEKEEFKTNIILAIFNEYNISNCIKTNQNSFKNFFTFGLTRDICTKEYLIDEIRDIRAKATNEIYNKNAEPKYQKSWEERSYFEKESNRASADHIKIKQKYLKIDNSDLTIEKLARCEHNRWSAFHYLNGWKYAKKRNPKIKLHHCLVPYDNLDESNKAKDRAMVKNIDMIINYKLKGR